MQRRESEEFSSFETSLFLVGGVKPYLRIVSELARLLPPAQGDLARAIDDNVSQALWRLERAQESASELARLIGYTYLRQA